ncbi:hypothetical protein FRC18_010154 [Serendipita sp. 400]|nr:hypothetical protein FRC18_010154 [Serendipita sp. 400]
MMPGATTSTADVTTVSALFRSRDDTGLSFMLGDAVSFLGDDLPEDLGDHDYN